MNNLNPFYYALSLLETLYGITVSEDEFEEIAFIAWGLIGNKRTKIYRYRTNTNNGEVDLPCNLYEIEAVTSDTEEWDYSNGITNNGNLSSLNTETYIEGRKEFQNPLYAPGKFILYEKVGNKLYFPNYQGPINILYRGLISDNEGLPEITDKEATAIASYCAYVLKYKEGLLTNNPNIMSIAENIKQKWNVQIDLARVDHYMTQNDWDEVLDAKTNWARKEYNKSLKLIK